LPLFTPIALLTAAALAGQTPEAPDVSAVPAVPVGEQPATSCASDPTLPLTELPLTAISSVVEGSRGCVLLFELYASWCGPCVKQAPAIKALSETYQSQGLLVRGVSADSDRERLGKFLETHGGVFAPVVLEDWTLEALRAEFAEIGGEFEDAIPLYLLYDREGKLLYQASEPKELEALEVAIQGAL